MPTTRSLKLLRPTIILWLTLSTLPVSAEERPLAPQNIEGAIIVNAEELIKLIYSNPGMILVDSRKQDEFIKGHIEGAINLLNTDLTEIKLKTVAPSVSEPIAFYCNGPRCLRSSDAVTKALSWGYNNVFWFRSGWKEWQDERLPVATGK